MKPIPPELWDFFVVVVTGFVVIDCGCFFGGEGVISVYHTNSKQANEDTMLTTF